MSRRTSSPELIRRAAETAALADARRGRGRLVLVPDFSHDPLQPPGPKPRPPTLYGSSWDASYRLDSEQSAVRISSPRRPGTHLPPKSTGAPGQATLGHLPLPQLGRRIHRAILPPAATRTVKVMPAVGYRGQTTEQPHLGDDVMNAPDVIVVHIGGYRTSTVLDDGNGE